MKKGLISLKWLLHRAMRGAQRGVWGRAPITRSAKKSSCFPFLVLLSSALVFSGCRPLVLYGVNPEGPAEYQLGWEDGCDSGLSAGSAIFYKMMYGFKKRPEMGANDLYKQGWNEGFTYCRFAIDATDKGPDASHGVFGVFY